jgi:hypothetical protein
VLEHCGGHPLPIVRQLGCVNYANNTGPFDTDDMNPLFEQKFWQLWDDVGGLVEYSVTPLLPLGGAGLPRYLPLLQNRNLRSSRLLDTPAVALRLFDVVGRQKNGVYAAKYPNGAALRAAYRLRPNTQVLLVGVDNDRPLETFWAKHRRAGFCESLANLGLGVTAPNFSYFTCAPRFQILRNRKRILLSSERLSNAGIPVSSHLNANTDGDWEFWSHFFREHTEVTSLTMEFQTGSRASQEVGQEAFDRLVAMQARLPRPLHCFLVGAGRYYPQAHEKLAAFTVIDSQPFMRALAREVLTRYPSGRFFWKKTPTEKHAPLHDLFETNMIHYEDKLSASSSEDPDSASPEPAQPDLPWAISTPYFTAHPVAPGISAMNSGATRSRHPKSVSHAPTV